MAIKITKLTVKLIRLANNNPNENEANSAARRACQLIGEALDKRDSTKTEPKYYDQSYSSPYEDIFSDWYKSREYTWTGFDTSQSKPKCQRCGDIIPDNTKVCDNCKREEDELKEAEYRRQQQANQYAKSPYQSVNQAGITLNIKCLKCGLITNIGIDELKIPKPCIRCGFKI